MEDLVFRRDALSHRLQKALKTCKPEASFDVSYWQKRKTVAEVHLELAQLKEMMKALEWEDNHNGAWADSDLAKAFHIQVHSLNLDVKLISDHIERLGTVGLQRTMFVKLFTTNMMGLGVRHSGMGRRETRLQANFRHDLIRDYGVRHPDPSKDALFCPILGRYFESALLVAAHLFPYRHGQELMTEIFGSKSSSDLFSARNGLLLHHEAEKRLDAGLMILIPIFLDQGESSDNVYSHVSWWQTQKPKDYMIVMPDTKHALLQTRLTWDNPEIWLDLNHRKLTFPNGFRPRARYVYFRYICETLKKSWTREKAGSVLRNELGFPFWGTPGPYVKKNMLSALIHEVGHDYIELLEGGESSTDSGDEGASPDPTLLATMNLHVRKSLFPQDEDEVPPA